MRFYVDRNIIGTNAPLLKILERLTTLVICRIIPTTRHIGVNNFAAVRREYTDDIRKHLRKINYLFFITTNLTNDKRLIIFS